MQVDTNVFGIQRRVLSIRGNADPVTALAELERVVGCGDSPSTKGYVKLAQAGICLESPALLHHVDGQTYGSGGGEGADERSMSETPLSILLRAAGSSFVLAQCSLSEEKDRRVLFNISQEVINLAEQSKSHKNQEQVALGVRQALSALEEAK